MNPDSPQKYVRAEALRRGIRVYVPTPRLKAGFLKLDPAKIPYDSIHDASQMSKSAKWAEPVALTDLPQLDAIVTGCVAVTDTGRRAGDAKDIVISNTQFCGNLGMTLCRWQRP